LTKNLIWQPLSKCAIDEFCFRSKVEQGEIEYILGVKGILTKPDDCSNSDLRLIKENQTLTLSSIF
jgi:hypothetical protein